LTRWLLVAVATALRLLGLTWGALHWLIVPRIDQFRPQLEVWATQSLGVRVRVGAVAAQSKGMVPSFELKDVTLLDAQDRVALRLPKVLIALSPRSLWRFGFEQIYIDRPVLDVRRDVNGKITMAGLDFSDDRDGDTAALDWFFSQFEFAIHDGTLRWTDELRGAEPVLLSQVAVVVRNRGRHHDVRLDATPPESLGSRFSLRGRFLQPLLTRQNGRWETWEGQLYAEFERADLAEMRHYMPLGVELTQGRGALRAWLEVNQGRVTQVAADVALAEVQVVLGADLQPLAVQRMQGRLGGQRLPFGFEFFTQSLRFDTLEGLHWPGGDVFLRMEQSHSGQPERGELQVDRLDLAALAQIASRLPLDASLRERLQTFAPKGRVDSLQASWQGALSAPQAYAAKGRVSQLEIAAVADVPGVKGLDVDFDFDQQAGQARLAVVNGSVDLPGIFQEPVIPVTSLAANARWQRQGERVALQLDQVKFANADAEGEAQIKWETADPAKSLSRALYPGVLDLQANLSRAEGKRVYRYLPLVIDQEARDYVRDAVLDGQASAVRFQVKGEIDQLPLIDPKKGAFRISAQVAGARLAYVPPSLQDSGDLPWPVLTDLSGELVIDRMQLQVNKARATLGVGTALQVTQVEARIDDLEHSKVNVNADIKGPLPEMMRLVNASPLRAMTDQALAASVVSGSATYQLKLLLPIADIDQSSVRGSVTLAGNDVQITPDSPKLTRARGRVNFTEAGVSLTGVQAQMLGGEVRLEGGLLLVPESPAGRGAPTLIRASGVASAEGLRQATELGFVSRLARKASGTAAYTASLGLRKGVVELLVNSNLQGVALSLPEPLGKSADTLLPLRLQTALLADRPLPLQDRLSLSVANQLQLVYERDVSKAEPRVLRGALEVGLDGQESAPLPAAGVAANIRLKNLNVDAWHEVLTQATGAAAAGATTADVGPLASSYLPDQLAVRSDLLTFGGRQFNQMVIGGGREGGVWRANLAASELNGYLEYRQPNTSATGGAEGRVFARLARLTIAPSVASDVEALLEAQPASIPALDFVVDDFELRGKHLGRLEVQAINRRSPSTPRDAGVREWRLNQFNLSAPEAKFVASGNWVALNGQTPGARRTAMNFKLDVGDSGALLSRLGMKDVVRGGRGKACRLSTPSNLAIPGSALRN
jgi:uncharacterized protein (TIGR02099 family)